MKKRVVISCGPIPARLDSVKFITNRFKGGLAFKTADYLVKHGFDVTIVKWKFTEIDQTLRDNTTLVVNVNDVFDYYNWFEQNACNYDAFVMAAAVANLTPSNPYEGKFPSHNYKIGEKFNIQFEIAPRAIDVVKQKNPRACLIGYKLFDTDSDEELTDIARHTLADAKANIIFANRPKDAKSRKLAVFADNTVLECNFEEHLELIARAISQEYFKTNVENFDHNESNNASINHAIAIIKMFERTFNKFGTVAIPVNDSGSFVTTSRGHKGNPVLVRNIDYQNRIVYASDKATLNAPLLGALVKEFGHKYIIVHRHEDDLNYKKDVTFNISISSYLFPGTEEETNRIIRIIVSIKDAIKKKDSARIKLLGHGDISILPIRDVDWTKYHSLFPEKYFSIPEKMQETIDKYKEHETLELGANERSDAKYSYDPFVNTLNSINLTWDEVLDANFDLVFAKNAVNYLSVEELKEILKRTNAFIANSFRTAPYEKITDNEASVLVSTVTGNKVLHALRLPDDSIIVHSFYAHGEIVYKELGLDVELYGKNSCLITKNI